MGIWEIIQSLFRLGTVQYWTYHTLSSLQRLSKRISRILFKVEIQGYMQPHSRFLLKKLDHSTSWRIYPYSPGSFYTSRFLLHLIPFTFTYTFTFTWMCNTHPCSFYTSELLSFFNIRASLFLHIQVSYFYTSREFPGHDFVQIKSGSGAGIFLGDHKFGFE